MNIAFTVALTTSQTVELFRAKKPDSQSWHEHMLYLMAAKNATGASEALILENIGEYASPTMRNLFINRVESRNDYAVHARELATWAQVHDEKARSARELGTIVGSVAEGEIGGGRRETRTCNHCKIKGHLEKDCHKKAKGIPPSDDKADFALSSVHTDDLDEDDWVLDSGASVHLVRDKRMLQDTQATDEGCVLPDGSKLLVTHRGTATVSSNVDGIEKVITLSNACYSPKVAVNLISMGTLLEKGCTLVKRNGRLAMLHSGRVMWYVHVRSRVLVIDRGGDDQEFSPLDAGRMVLNAVRDAALDQDPPTPKQVKSLVHFHMRFGHLSYDTIERMADALTATIELSDRDRPIDLKGPMTPADRRGNRYMINFVCHASNYCRVFLAKRKNAAAQQFAHFLVWFEKRFDVKVHVLRTDGGGEYQNVDLFCRTQGRVARQVTEARNQAANGKAERMHRTIMNMVRCMLFGTVYDGPGKNALQRRGVPGIIMGENDQTKGFKVYLPRQQIVKTTRHVSKVETLDEAANARLQRVLEDECDADLADLAALAQECQQHQPVVPAAAPLPASGNTQPVEVSTPLSAPVINAPPPRRSERYRKESAKKCAARATTTGEATAQDSHRSGSPLIAHVLAMSTLGAGRAEFKTLPDPKGDELAVAATMIFTSLLFFIIGITAYITDGCQGNVLFAITGTSLLNSSRATIVLAYMFMHLHITMAMAVILSMVLYIAERSLLGIHKRLRNTEKEIVNEESHAPFHGGLQTATLKEAEPSEYREPKNIIKFVVLRYSIVGNLFHDQFIDISDFVGAPAISMGGIT
ncbi:TPA: hypothetical protein N0F65_009583 [Lagenidium giganteum]|uniref:Integrase catalytic domain-containing protein n=1 Tax=Lagenidium giganteum TaxID=4803 RepID=A0AAV2YJZ4_9STRA|nr:TPA: hypothetical protein N0F65_009583 [Lagenidium giganteum]